MKNNRKPRILNVDDDDAGRYTITRILRQAGFEVQEAATGREALRLAEECPDLILLDVNLPDISGLEVCRQIRANRRTAAIPVVHLSATFVGGDDRAAGLEQGADGYLTQPVEPKVLVATINAFLRLKAAEQALRESEERFKNLYQKSPIPTFTWQKKGDNFILIDFNCAAIQMTDGKVRDLLGNNAVELYTNSPQVLNDMNLCFQERSVVSREIVSLHFAPGRFLSVHYGFVPPDLIIVHTQDQTERQSATKALIGILEDEQLARASLQESEERFRAIFERSTVGQSQTAPDGKLLRINKAFADMLGYTIEEIQQVNFAQITHPDDVAEGRECLRILLAGEQTAYRFEKRYIHKSGNIVWVDLSTTLLRDEQGTPLYLITSIVDITERKKAEESLKETLESLRKAVNTTIQVMVSTVERRDPYTAGHQIRSAALARTIATEMGLSPEKIEGIRIAGSIHDIGKLSIPVEILSKPTKLSEIEFSLIKEHARQGYEILKDVESSWPLAEMVYQHHERIDGSGYPRNLKGEEICMEARILAVADVVEAMASHRPYRAGLGIDAALAEIEKNRGIFYDDAVADTCLRLFREKEYRLAEA